jgi:hypothetical protein
MSRTVLRSAAPALALAILVLVPFRESAFTIDDTLFLFEARHALADPLHPSALETVWSADPPVPVRMSQILPNGPVMAWLLVPSVLANGSETIAHLAELAALALAIAATVALALRLGLAPRWAMCSGVLVAATPVALAMAGTAMPDVPAMALGVAGLERLVAWRDERRVHQGVLAALLLGLAPLARSHVIMLLGVGALLVAGDYLRDAGWRRAGWTAWLPLAVAPVITVAIMVATRDPLGSSFELARVAASFAKVGQVPRNIVSFAMHWVLAIPLALPWVLIRRGSIARRWWVLLLATGAAAFLLEAWQNPSALASAAIAGLGATVLFDILAVAWNRRESMQLTLGLWLLTALPVAIYVHLPSKYLLASAPAAALLVARALAERSTATARWIVPVTAVAGIALGVAILRADAAFAGLGRRAAAELVAPNVAAGRRVWFVGNWGFQWYAERAGGLTVSLAEPSPAAGDLLVTTEKTDVAPALKQMLVARYRERTRLIATVADHSPGGRVMDPELGAGFFSNAWGNYPWAWGDDLLDAFELWRIE